MTSAHLPGTNHEGPAGGQVSSAESQAYLPQPGSGDSLPPIALVGLLDLPTDGIRDYCSHLSAALARRGDHLEIVEVRWETQGWLKAIRRLWKESRSWKGRWVLIQYTALMWSRHGFPVGALAVLRILKLRGAEVCVVFHDVTYDPARGFIRRLRVACQYRTMRIALRWAACSILTVPPAQLAWLPDYPKRTAFIPVGSNFPGAGAATARATLPSVPTVAVFGVTWGPRCEQEVKDIAYAMKQAAARLPRVRLMVIGRGSREAEPALRRELSGTNVELSVLGVLPPKELRQNLSQADVMLCVRGHISSRRGSAIAGIECGLPVIGYRGPETALPMTEAGVLLFDSNDLGGLADALTRVLTDERLYQDLRQRNLIAAQKYFSWDAIAAQFIRVLSGPSHER